MALLKEAGIDQAVVAGDTRFDRVLTAAGNTPQIPAGILNFCHGHPVVVAGSTWEEDELMFAHFIKNNSEVKFIFVPHEVHPENIENMQKHLPNAVVYTEIKDEEIPGNILIINTIGLLSGLYSLARVTYIGGGFNRSGIHNTLEAAVWGKPVVFGPNYEKFMEARGLISAGAGFSYNNPVELESILSSLLHNSAEAKKAGESAALFVREHAGATRKIMEFIYENRLLTN